jgi:hypothetical protein
MSRFETDAMLQHIPIDTTNHAVQQVFPVLPFEFFLVRCQPPRSDLVQHVRARLRHLVDAHLPACAEVGRRVQRLAGVCRG